jgi:hypothetical protein
MIKTKYSIAVSALAAAAAASPAYAADGRYPVTYVQKVEITHPSHRSAWENKDFLDCDDVVLTEEDVFYALRYMRRISCEGKALVTFKSGKILAMGIEPTGRISAGEFDAGMKPTTSPPSFYECDPCRQRKMALLKDALNRADERRLKRLVAEGRISEVEAERRLNWVRDQRDKP